MERKKKKKGNRTNFARGKKCRNDLIYSQMQENNFFPRLQWSRLNYYDCDTVNDEIIHVTIHVSTLLVRIFLLNIFEDIVFEMYLTLKRKDKRMLRIF